MDPYNNSNSCTGRMSQHYKAKESLGLGITQILIGILLIVLNAIGIVLDRHSISIIEPYRKLLSRHTYAYEDFHSIFYMGHGLWCGVFFIFTGSLGVGAKSKKACLVITFMVFSSLSALMSIVVVGFSARGIEDTLAYEYFVNQKILFPIFAFSDPNYGGNIAVHSVMLVLAFVETIVAIWSIVICCRAACCGKKQETGTQHEIAMQTGNHNQIKTVSGKPNAITVLSCDEPQGRGGDNLTQL